MRLVTVLIGLVAVCGVFAGAAYFLEYHYFARPETILGPPRFAVDGNTLNYGYFRVRLHGMDAPDIAQYCFAIDGEKACGRESRDMLNSLARRQPLKCEVKKRDAEGYLVAVCIDTDTRADIASEMVRSGWAVAHGAYEKEEAEARAAHRGMWNTLFERPEEWRARKTRTYLEHYLNRTELPGLVRRMKEWYRRLRGME
ncbi:MAG: thermonuclease family protein [Methylobacteriaceae bacterium]|jgi:endonuclease YncB( thermonuclease family)|nr:thermonuclease family protein [Methylobacteriaceae bacterium]